MKKLVKESLFEQEGPQITKTTVGKLMIWYRGDGWFDEPDISDTMLVDGERDEKVEYFLADNINTPIEVINSEMYGDIGYDLSFELEGKLVTIESVQKPFLLKYKLQYNKKNK